MAWRSAMSHARNHERAHDLKEQLRSSTAEPITLSSELPRSQMEATLHPPAVPSHVSRVFSTFSVKAGQSASHIRLQDVNPFPVLGSILTYSTVAATAVSGEQTAPPSRAAVGVCCADYCFRWNYRDSLLVPIRNRIHRCDNVQLSSIQL